jgi:hypothetical protein
LAAITLGLGIAYWLVRDRDSGAILAADKDAE